MSELLEVDFDNCTTMDKLVSYALEEISLVMRGCDEGAIEHFKTATVAFGGLLA